MSKDEFDFQLPEVPKDKVKPRIIHIGGSTCTSCEG